MASRPTCARVLKAYGAMPPVATGKQLCLHIQQEAPVHTDPLAAWVAPSTWRPTQLTNPAWGSRRMLHGPRAAGLQVQWPRQREGLNPGASRAKKENDLMPESPGPREDKQACPEEGCHSPGSYHRVPVTPGVLLRW